MHDSISISVPYDFNALTHAADMLANMAADLGPKRDLPEEKDLDATAVFSAHNVSAIDTTPTAHNVSAVDTSPAPDTIGLATTQQTPPPPTNVEVDKNGIPWDGRIHANTKTKDVNGAWKYKRGIDRGPALAQLETELRAAVSQQTQETQETQATDVASTTTTTFAQLVTGITANGIDGERVSTAVAQVGVDSLAVLAARADLIPVVAGKLGL